MAGSSLCSVPGCYAPCRGRSRFCPIHYFRWKHSGNPLGGGRGQSFYRDIVLHYEGDECLIWPYATTPTGYGRLRIGGRWQIVSHAVCEEVNGQPPTPLHQAAHTCGKGHLGCVAKRHVEWKTAKENSDDRVRHGTLARGENMGTAKLTEGDVSAIRASKETSKTLAGRYNVSSSTVRAVRNRRIWAWLP